MRPRALLAPTLCVVASALVVAGVRGAVAEPVRVTSSSMEPGLRAGDVVLVDRRDVDVGDLERGDLVTFRSPLDGTETLKRVVALPGDSVAVLDALLHVNDRAVEEPYVDYGRWDGTFSQRVEVPEASVFVLGDNRLPSIDSRDYGPVPVANLDGRVLVRLWPPVRVDETAPPPRRD